MSNHAPRSPSIPVICDRCRAEGIAGESGFADFGDLLDFDPVPLQVDRVDGYNPEAQRAFIAALSVMGSSLRAAAAIGKSATGAERLRRLEGSEGFRRAWVRAKAIAQEKGTMRLAETLQGVVRPAPALPPPAPPPPPEPDEEEQLQDAEQWLFGIARKYMVKIGEERAARLAGEVVAADFYLRQLTFIEVAMDLMGTGGFDLLHAFRRDGRSLVDIAETPFSRILGEARRIKWEELGEPAGPEAALDRHCATHR